MKDILNDRKILTLVVTVSFCCASTHAAIFTDSGGLGTADHAFEGTSTVEFFYDVANGEVDVHDDQAYGDNVIGLGPDANGFKYGNAGKDFMPNQSAT